MWYPVPWSNPVLGMPSRIQSLDQCPYPWAAKGVGEVYNTPRTYNAQKAKPFVTGNHVCGTPEDFAGHSARDADLPPVVYTDDGLPLCCLPPFVSQGGAVGGTWSPPPLTPNTCSTAIPVNLDTNYSFDLGGVGSYWFALSVPISHPLRIVAGGTAATTFVNGWDGTDCSNRFLTFWPTFFLPGCGEYDALASGLSWFEFVKGSATPGSIDFRISNLNC